MPTIRVALCQLECHPAISTSHLNYLNEPFVPEMGKPSLSLLSTKGLDVVTIEALCREQYLKWHEARVASALAALAAFDPLPDIVLFPEGSLPIENLVSVGQWSATTGATVLAGSHSPRRSTKPMARYRELGLSKETLNRLFKYGETNTLPIIRAGEVTLIPKRLASPFERSIISAPSGELPIVKPYLVQPSNIRILPLICSEALQLHALTEVYDMVTIVAYDSRAGQFHAYIEQQVANGKPVALCNDGASGHSSVHTVIDRRTPDWMRDALPDGLPPGDAILVADLNLSVTAIEVGTAVPRQPLRLVALASITAEQSMAGNVSATLREIRTRSEPSARAYELTALLERSAADPLQRIRIEHLRRLETEGVPSDVWWAVIGVDCIVPARQDLRQLEATLAATCSRELMSKTLSSPLALQGDTPSTIVSFLSECNRRAVPSNEGQAVSPLAISSEAPTAIVDRDAEIREIHAFLDDPALVILELSGLQQIGKSAVLAKAFAESGIRSVLRIPLTETSSAEYIVHALLRSAAGSLGPQHEDPLELAKSSSMSEVLKTLQVVVLERSHLLLNRGAWRDELIPRVLDTIAQATGQTRCKLVFETRRQLPLTLSNPLVRKPLRVYGLDKSRSTYGVSLFDAQLRRAGLSPTHIGTADKAFIVNRLGGHPVAIALAADTAYEHGAAGMVEALKSHQGFFLNFVSRLIRSLELSDQDRILLEMLCLARVGVPRESLLRAADFPAGEAIRELVVIGAVEVTPDDLLEVASVLREYFDPERLSRDQRQAFHKAAAEAYASLAQARGNDLAAAIEAEFHAGVIGVGVPESTATQLFDGALGSAFHLFQSGEYEKAGNILRPLLRRRHTVDILRLAAKIEAHRNNFDLALVHAKEAFKRNPRDTQLLAELAKIALNQYRDDVAEAMISMARAAGVEAVSILIVEGRMRLRRSEFGAAEQAFRRAISLTTNNPWPFYYLGVAFMNSGRLLDAVEVLEEGETFYYERECRGRSALRAIRTKRAVAHLLLANYDLAGPIVDRLVEEDPDNPEVLRAQGALIIAREGIQQIGKALELLTRARVKSRRDRAQLHLFTGTFYLAINDRLGAAEEFRRGKDADSGNVLIMMKLARTVYDLAVVAYRNADESYRAYLEECKSVTRQILRYDRDNVEGIALLEDVGRVFNEDV